VFNILDPRFKYVPSCKTDIRETFAKARQQQEAVAAHKRAIAANDEMREIHTPDPMLSALLKR
jgi:hypothetical protein